MEFLIVVLKCVCIGQAGILGLVLLYILIFNITQRILLRNIDDAALLQKRYSIVYGDDMKNLLQMICKSYRTSMIFSLIAGTLFLLMCKKADWDTVGMMMVQMSVLCILTVLGSLLFEVLFTILKPTSAIVDIAEIKRPLHKLYLNMVIVGILFAYINWFVTYA